MSDGILSLVTRVIGGWRLASVPSGKVYSTHMPPAIVSPSEGDRRVRLERTLALARLSLAVLALIVAQVEVPAAGSSVWVIERLPILFTGYAFLAAILVGSVPWVHTLGWSLQVTDTVWAVAITAGNEGPSSTFFVFVVFVLVSAAYRGGLRPTLLTGLGTVLLLVVEASVGPLGLLPIPTTPLEPVQIGIRSGYCVGLAWLIGYLAEEQSRSRTQAAATARLLAAVDLSGGLRLSVQRVLHDLVDMVDAARGVMLFEEGATGRAYRWSLDRDEAAVRIDELPETERHDWLFPLPSRGQAWRIRRRRERLDLLSDTDATPRSMTSLRAAARLPFERGLDIGALRAGGEWTGRLLLFDSAARVDGRTLRWLGALTSQLGPALHSLYLLRRLRTRISAMEQARLARELHDGIIQSLVGLEMQVAVLGREVSAGRAVDPGAIERIQELLHKEVINVRELMQQIRPVEVSRGDLPQHLAEIVERFRRDTGIGARFVSALDDADIPPRLARELVRITQEALVNVRKHSGATDVVIRFGASGGDWTLVIDDNGVGCGFTGRFGLDELDAARRGPLVIKERVRGIRGSLLLESVPGQGTNQEIRVPRR
jgi:signal transduction histidine kinase